jgi:glucose/arabinose dehydrogenase
MWLSGWAGQRLLLHGAGGCRPEFERGIFLEAIPMKRHLILAICCLAALAAAVPSCAEDTGGTKPGAFADWRADAPGVVHRITPDGLPAPYATRSAGNAPREVPQPADARLAVPAGFQVNVFAKGLSEPRTLRVAPNGDVFVAEMNAGRVRVLRPGADGTSAAGDEVFASGLSAPFGIAFHPPGPEPRWVYVAEVNRVVRYPYRAGEMKPAGPAEVIVPQIAPSFSGHITRDIAFSNDGRRMFVSVGSATNVAEGGALLTKAVRDVKVNQAWEERTALGAAWGAEEHRANVLVFTPEGKEARIFATGLRNCVGLAVHPAADEPWCAVNERDGLGDDLVPDYVTRVRDGGFYGWPWYYTGGNEDPRHKGARPDLAGKVTVPDVLIQPHSAPLSLTFYNGAMFPPAYRGSAFVALHGSWNRSKRTGYKVVRIAVRDGVPAGEYEDFLTGFVVDEARVWGRPVGLAVARDGALLLSEDAGGTIWRVSHRGGQ